MKNSSTKRIPYRKKKYSNEGKSINRDIVEKAMAIYLENGGKITILDDQLETIHANFPGASDSFLIQNQAPTNSYNVIPSLY